MSSQLSEFSYMALAKLNLHIKFVECVCVHWQTVLWRAKKIYTKIKLHINVAKRKLILRQVTTFNLFFFLHWHLWIAIFIHTCHTMPCTHIDAQYWISSQIDRQLLCTHMTCIYIYADANATVMYGCVHTSCDVWLYYSCNFILYLKDITIKETTKWDYGTWMSYYANSGAYTNE